MSLRQKLWGALKSGFQRGVDLCARKAGRDSFLYKASLQVILQVNGENDSSGLTNGESFFLKHNLRPGDVVFDAGAHFGQWARLCLQYQPDISLHCFEPSHFTFQQLQRMKPLPSVRLNNRGLGSSEGPAVLRIFAEGNEANSLYLRRGALGWPETTGAEQVEITTLDNYCARNQIPHIDLLKIDVEGYELEVLKGASQLLINNKIGLVQFEYSACYIDARVFLIDVFDFIRGLCPSARFSKIFPRELLEIHTYDQRLKCGFPEAPAERF